MPVLWTILAYFKEHYSGTKLFSPRGEIPGYRDNQVAEIHLSRFLSERREIWVQAIHLDTYPVVKGETDPVVQAKPRYISTSTLVQLLVIKGESNTSTYNPVVKGKRSGVQTSGTSI